MIVRHATSRDVPKILKIMESCDLISNGIDYTRWDGIVLVAERQSEVVGFIACLPAKPYAIITEMGVLPAHRKGRAASKLIEALELLLRSLDCRAWMAYVGEKRTDAIEGLKHHGAIELGHGASYLRRLT